MIRTRIFLNFLFVTFSLAAFTQTNESNALNAQFKQKDTSFWIHNFREFRDAVYKGDKTKAKEFFDFPFQSDGNEIWLFAYSENEKALETLDESPRPFTEKDFDKYFGKIFSKPFLKCLLKIKTDELYKNGESESPEIKDSTTTYQLYATYDKTSRILELNLATNTPVKISETEYDPGEASFIYRFKVLKNGHIKFVRVFIAG